MARAAANNVRREQVLAAAGKIFRDKGYDGTKISDIAAELGMLKGSLYYHFKSKEDLYFEIVSDEFASWARYLAILKEEGVPPLERLDRFIRVTMTDLAGMASLAQTFDRDNRVLSPEKHREIIRLRDVHDNALEELLVEAQANGDLPQTFDPRLMSVVLLSLLTSTQRWFRSDGRLTAQQLADTLAEFVRAGVQNMGS